MGKIVALGGGEIGRPGHPVETTAIDREMIRLTGKKHPLLLFLPTASKDSQQYVDTVQEHFGKRLGCRIEPLLLWKQAHSRKELRKKILGADIIYVGGGNTASMMRRWRALGVDKLLWEAHGRGIVMSGVSAGSICWFRHGHSDSRRMKDPKALYIKVRGLGIIPALHCPHTYREPGRKPSLKPMMRTTPGIALGIDDCAAIEIVDGRYRILSSRPGRGAHKCYWRNGKYYKERLLPSAEYSPIDSLFRKNRIREN